MTDMKYQTIIIEFAKKILFFSCNDVVCTLWGVLQGNIYFSMIRPLILNIPL